MTKLALLASAACVLAGLLAPVGSAAQVYATGPQASDADRLGNAMRTIGANPQDVDALTIAGELSLRVGDAAGAAALLARAEKIQPMNGRVKAGMGSILVHEERPGAALRYFNQAEGYGWPAERFAAERGFAYDLIGEQERAQRDYRLAMRSGGTNDEVTRRYALSLGISGKRDLALEQIDGLIRRGDRGAWRARAFILAMNGDVAGAEKIATSMMPPGAAGGLQPFFVRLSTLPAVDRAFAVHFGETRATPARVTDARLVPALAALGADPYAPRVVEVAAVVPAARDARRERRDRRGSRRSAQVALVAQPAPSPAASVAAAPAPPAYARFPVPSAATAVVQALPVRAPAPVAVAAVQPSVVPRIVSTPYVAPLPVHARAVSPAMAASTVPVPAGLVPRPVATASLPATANVGMAPAAAARVVTTSGAVAATVVQPVRPVPAPGLSSGVAASAPVVASVPAGPAVQLAGAVAAPAVAVRPAAVSGPPDTRAPAAVVTTMPVPAPAAPAPVVAAAALPGPPRGGGDDILARIVANISVPGAELDVAPARPAPVVAAVVDAAPPVRSEPAVRAEPAPRPVQLAAVRPVAVVRPVPVGRTPVPAPVGRTRRAAKPVVADEPAPAASPTPVAKPDARTRAATRAADRKTAERVAAAKKLADEKALAAKRLADEKKVARADAPRIWVQVAGGAEEGDLPKAYSTVKAKAPALAGRAAYATPLRATNRVLTGPFKTDAEARAFVNQLAKQGVSAFTFTSTQGQKVMRLPAK